MKNRVALPMFVLSAVFGSLAFAGASQAFAADVAVYPGTMCEATAGSVIRTTDGAVNSISSHTTVVCPIVRDAVKPSGNALSFAHIVVKGQTVVCKLHRRDGSGAQGTSLSKNLETPGGNGTRVLQFTTSLSTTSSGTFFFVCDLPFGAQVFSYRAEEAL